jgi:tetratricopeptide (TPR) repeat protein
MEWLYAKGIPIEAQYLFRKGLELEMTGRLKEACGYFRQAVMLAPKYARAIHEMGNCLAKMGYYERAREKYSQAVRINSPAGHGNGGDGATGR